MMEENAILQETIISMTDKSQEMEKIIKEFEISNKAAAKAIDVAEELRKKVNEMETALELKKQEHEEKVFNLEAALSLSEEARKSKVSELEGILVETEDKNRNLKGELEQAVTKLENETSGAVAECELLREEVQRLQE